MTTPAQKILRRALTNGARVLDEEARRRKHYLMGGVPALEQEAQIIRENIEALCEVDVKRPEGA